MGIITLAFSEICGTVQEASGAQAAPGPFLSIDLVVSSSSHKAVSSLNVNMSRLQIVLHYVCYFWAKKFKVQASEGVFQGAVRVSHSPVPSDVTKQATAISELAESLSAFKQHRWESSHASVMFWKYRIKYSPHNTCFDESRLKEDKQI